MRVAVVVLAVIVGLPVAASEVGQPLDCSDWVFLEPGLTCREVSGWPCPSTPNWDPQVDPTCVVSNFFADLDNNGDSLAVRVARIPGVACPTVPAPLRLELVLRDRSGQERILAYVATRCGPTFTDVVEGFSLGNYRDERHIAFAERTVVRFDRITGTLYVTAEVYCSGSACPYQGNCPYVGCVPPLRVFALEGFTTLFDVLQSYEPTSGTLSFRTPIRPEGFAGADAFDTYWGDLATVGDWSQSQGLECGYPNTPPAVGDYLEVTDTLPTPRPGQGYYYVTAAHYMGETRYGRKTTGGRLTGRDPAALPACVNAEVGP